jgi:hypothetical protein
VYHLKNGFDWKLDLSIPSIEIELVIFFSRCFTKAELRYGSTELEVVCFVWICKRLYTLLYSNNGCIVVFIDYNTIRGIVNSIILNTISTDRANRRFTNASVYLLVYFLDVYYMFGRLNFVLDALSRLRAFGDDVVH